MKKHRKVFLLAFFIIILASITTPSNAARREVKRIYLKGTPYAFDDVKKVKLSGSKVTITGSLKKQKWKNGNFHSYTKKLKSKKRTYRIDKRIKKYYYTGLTGYYYEKVKRKEFIAECKKYKKGNNYGPFITIWVKNNKIIGYLREDD